jgi:phosphopantetheinyl transferase
LHLVSGAGLEAQLVLPSPRGLFAAEGALQTPAVLLDCACQLAGYWLVEGQGRKFFGSFPYQIRSFHQYGPPPASGQPIICRGSIGQGQGDLAADFDFLDQEGRLLCRLEGLHMRYFKFPERYFMRLYWPEADSFLGDPWPPGQEEPALLRLDCLPREFLEDGWGIWQRALAHIALGNEERRHYYGLPSRGPRRGQWLLGRLAAKDALLMLARQRLGMVLAPADVEIMPDGQGRPEVHSPELAEAGWRPTVSLSHCGPLAAAAASTQPQELGLDVESLRERQLGDWLKEAFAPQELTLVPPDDHRLLLAMWCAKEAAAKALGLGLGGAPRAWKVLKLSPDHSLAVVEHQGRRLKVSLWYKGEEIMALCRENEADKGGSDETRPG